jgi:hypothetical protein
MQRKAPEDMPEFLREMIENDTFKDQPKEFQDRILASFKAIALGEVSPQVREFSKFTKKEMDRFFEIAKATNLLCEHVEQYVQRDWTPKG